MNKYEDFYDWGAWYNRRLFLWFIAFLMALFFFNEREWGLFIAKADDATIIQQRNQLYIEVVWENWMNDLLVDDVEQ